MDRDLIQRPTDMPVLGPARDLIGQFSDYAVLMVIGFAALVLIALAIRIARRARIARLYRRREALEARVTELRAAGRTAASAAAAVPFPTADMVACHFCREPVANVATVCPHCLRPAAHNLKSFVNAARQHRAALTTGPEAL